MIEFPIFWQYLIILVTHYVADFLLQTHWQASNKSKNNVALVEHVAVYTVVLAAVTAVLFGLTAMWFVFFWFNGVLHFCTDYLTSRWSSRYFKMAIDDMDTMRRSTKVYGDPNFFEVNPAKHWHNFFVVIGFDQLIHQATLAITLWMVVA